MIAIVRSGLGWRVAPKPTLRERAVALAIEKGEVRTKDLTDIDVHRCYLARMADQLDTTVLPHGLRHALSCHICRVADGSDLVIPVLVASGCAVGALFTIPIILTYTAWFYHVFRSKVKTGEGYHRPRALAALEIVALLFRLAMTAVGLIL